MVDSTTGQRRKADEMNAEQTFTTQEGTTFGMDGATCPDGHPSSLDHRTFPSGYFRCPRCNLLYDEPAFDPLQFVAGPMADFLTEDD